MLVDDEVPYAVYSPTMPAAVTTKPAPNSAQSDTAVQLTIASPRPTAPSARVMRPSPSTPGTVSRPTRTHVADRTHGNEDAQEPKEGGERLHFKTLPAPGGPANRPYL